MNSKVERGESQEGKCPEFNIDVALHPAESHCAKAQFVPAFILIREMFCAYLPATLRARFGFSGFSIDSGTTGSTDSGKDSGAGEITVVLLRLAK